MKTKLILSILIAITLEGAKGQNASLDANSTPISGTDCSAFGYQALNSNLSTGLNNTATGFKALYSNAEGDYNTANGWSALYNNTSEYNTAVGYQAIYSNTVGARNTAVGTIALFNNTSGDQNTAAGFQALYSSYTGNYNSGFGAYALNTNNYGSYNSALGRFADVSSGSLDNATAIGSGAIVNASNKIRFGDANVTVVEGPVAYTTSDARFKTDVKEEVKGLEFIKRLRPVVYNFDTKKFTEFLTKNMPDSIRKIHLEKDFGISTAIRQSGFIAQEVEKAAEESGYNFNGVHKPSDDNDNYSLSYSQFVVPLIKAVQEQQHIIEKQVEKIKHMEQQIEDLKKTSLSTGISQINIDPAGISMEQNEPNPFSHETLVKYNIPQTVNNAYMAVYDLSGKQITTFPITEKGSSSITITSEKLAAGIYIYSIVADGKIVDSKRMVVTQK